MGSNRKTAATKGGKYMNPTDQARKEDRKKQLKKHKKQREQVREAVIKNKNPNTVLDELAKLDSLEFDPENPCPYADRVMQEKRQRLRSTFFKILEYYKNTNKLDQWKEHQDEFNQYEKEKESKKSLFQAVIKAKNWSVDHIPLPETPQPDAGFFMMGGSSSSIAPPVGLPPKNYHAVGPSSNARQAPGPPPGPPPAKKSFKRRPKASSSGGSSSGGGGIQSKLLEIAGQQQPDEDERKTPPPPPSSEPPAYEKRPTYTTRPAMQQQPVAPAVQSHMVPPHISTWAQPQFAQPHGTAITAAPTTYKPNQPQEKEITSAPQLRTKACTNTAFLPTSLRRGGAVPPGGGGGGVPAKKQKFTPRQQNIGPVVPSSAPPAAPTTSKDSSDKAYEKFMREMSGLM